MERQAKPSDIIKEISVSNNKKEKSKMQTVSTGSTLLDLALSGGVYKAGGLVGGILVEISGAPGSGKTVLLSEIGGAVQRAGGEVIFNDPEARLNKRFAQIFDFDTGGIEIQYPDTVPEIFDSLKKWDIDTKKVNAVLADSLAALSTSLEMGEGDKMGTRRAKEMSEGLRKTCRLLQKKNILMVCSNQLRENVGVMFGEKYKTPGGLGIPFYSSVRLRVRKFDKIYHTEKIASKEVKKTIGVTADIHVIKNSIDKPYRSAPVTIIFDYGIDDIRQNLQYIKDYTDNTVYSIGGRVLNKSMEKAIEIIEAEGLEDQLRKQVIDLWNNIDEKFSSNRKKKQRG